MRALALIAVLCYATHAHAGAWLQEKDHGLFMLNATAFRSNAYFDEFGEKIDQPSFSKQEIQPYVEYGLRDWVTVGGSAYVHHVAQRSNDNWGIGDPELFARFTLHENARERFALQPLVKLPSIYLEGGNLRGGSRSVDSELSLLYGRNQKIISDRDYIDMRIGYRQRTRNLHSQWRADAAAGLYVSDNFWLIPAMRSIITTKYDDSNFFREDGEQDYDLYQLELTAAYQLAETRWVQATVFDHVAGAFTGDGRGISIGIAERF
jgi:hypothetical protein